jgi:hypothetical protein
MLDLAWTARVVEFRQLLNQGIDQGEGLFITEAAAYFKRLSLG